MTGASNPSMEAAWAELTRRWDDPAAHREFLSAQADLPALADAGRRYRAVLETRPTDALALAMKGEVLKRATIIGLAQLPRTRPLLLPSRAWPRRLMLAGVLSLAVTLSWMLGRLVLGAGP
jgi:hypothetical protein